MIPGLIEVALPIVTGLGGFVMKNIAQNRANQFKLIKLGMQQQKQTSELMDAAAKRSSPVLRKFVATFVIVCVFGAAWWAAANQVDVSVMEPKAQKELLWGMFKWGRTMEVTTAAGLVFPHWVKYSVLSIIGFLFGSGAAKIT